MALCCIFKFIQFGNSKTEKPKGNIFLFQRKNLKERDTTVAIIHVIIVM